MTTETNLQEIWKPIEFTDGKYSISNLGRVSTNGFYANVGNGGQRWVKPRIKCLGEHNQGYLNVSIFKKTYLVHRLVAEAFLSNPEGLEFVNHKDGNKKNNKKGNLEWCTRQENETHAYGTGLKNSTGSSNTMSKLTEDQVWNIKYIQKDKSSKELAAYYDVHMATIQRIKSNAIWKHV